MLRTGRFGELRVLEAKNQQQPTDSFKKRYLYKLGANLVSFLLALATAGLVPRGLGPVAYGDFNFLTNFFNQLINFFDSGTSSAFYTKLSQRLQEPGLLRFYWGFVCVLSLVLILFVAVIFGFGLENWLWPVQTARYVWFAVIWGLLTWYGRIIQKIVDAYGLTVGSEIARIRQRVLGTSLVLLMFWSNWFSLPNFFLYHYLIILYLCWSWWRTLKRAGLDLFPKMQMPLQQIKDYIREFYGYAGPLVISALAILLVGILDRWLLQRFAGPTEQGFFGLSQKIGTICFLFTSAMTPLFIRELSMAHGQRDTARMQVLYQRYLPLLYSVAAFFAIFLGIQSDKTALIFGGSEFKDASVAISIMAFYPINQTYGQLVSAFFFATGQTKIYRNLSIIMALLGLPFTFWLIAPQEWLGLDLGASGLALKTVMLQFVSVNLRLWFSVRLLNLPFSKFLRHQFYSIVLLTGIAGVSAIVVDRFIKSTLLAFLISGFIYALSYGVVLFIFPALISMSRTELKQQLIQIKNIF